ncbi:hypothetical protein CAPTEDRAFT_185546 [Capitella teleta]|uniref:Uncharacterized protein n=1 Tax=Capitella teleta TaxID=283909 RepID=R7T9M3_CAPTE|nr:hypothetical protein CAPTEDRAFT_185546 [Capitella teleta]|eukprot:ELT87674.1 hypothetical protein CAPTEDRAFT_185546 [Capitella teleta]
MVIMHSLRLQNEAYYDGHNGPRPKAKPKPKPKTTDPVPLRALSTDEVTRLYERAVEGAGCEYLGTYSAWGGPDVNTWAAKTRHRDTAFVANTDTIEDEGTHWTLFYLPKDPASPPYFFDSFGRDPANMGRPMWRNYLRAIADRRWGAGKGRPEWDVHERRADTGASHGRLRTAVRAGAVVKEQRVEDASSCCGCWDY